MKSLMRKAYETILGVRVKQGRPVNAVEHGIIHGQLLALSETIEKYSRQGIEVNIACAVKMKGVNGKDFVYVSAVGHVLEIVDRCNDIQAEVNKRLEHNPSQLNLFS